MAEKTPETHIHVGIVDTVPLLEMPERHDGLFKRNPAADAVIDFVAGCNGNTWFLSDKNLPQYIP